MAGSRPISRGTEILVFMPLYYTQLLEDRDCLCALAIF